jgi:hypothetical protein
MQAMLAIWSDIGKENETDYLHWLTREHTTERVSTPGFLSVRVFRAMRSDVSRYFICYALQDADVVNSPAYVAKLNAPTPWSQRIMPLLGNFRRGGGPVRAKAGIGRGGLIAPVILGQTMPADAKGLAASLAQGDRISSVSILEIDGAKTAVQTREKSMRKQDTSFAGLVLIEGLDDNAVRDARQNLNASAPGLASPEDINEPLYQHVFSLHKDMLT